MEETRQLGEIILNEDAASRSRFHALFDGKFTPGFDVERDLGRVAVVNQTTPVSYTHLPADLSVDLPRRRAIQRHHTATHLLHWALRKVLGTHVRQAGSLNAHDRLRFDFSHFEAVTHAQVREIEELVNQRVLDNAKVEAYEVDFDKKPEGTLAFFGEKYGKVVRVVDIGGYSRELCAGTHVATTGEIGFKMCIRDRRTPWSPPEQKAYFPSVWGPAPVRSTTPTDGSSRASANAAIICVMVSGLNAFRLAGLLIVTFAIPSAFW